MLISDEWFNAICWNSHLFGTFVIKNWEVFSLTSFGTFKYDCLIKTREMFNFLPLINNSVTIEFSFLLLIISAIISSKIINVLRSLYCTHQYFCKHLSYQKLQVILRNQLYFSSSNVLTDKQSLSRTRCWMKSLHSGSKLLSNGT